MTTQTATFNFRVLTAEKAKKVGFPLDDEKWVAEKDKESGEATKYKRPSVSLQIPAADVVDIANIIELGPESKEFKFVVDLINDAIYDNARGQVDDDLFITQEKLDLSKLTISYIAAIPPAERGRRGISKEQWEEFAADYVAVVSEVTGLDEEKVANQAAVFVKKYEPVKTKKEIIGALRTKLALWLENTKKGEELLEVFKFLDARAETLINAEEKDFTENLGL